MDKLIPSCQLLFKVLRNKKKRIDKFLFFKPSKRSRHEAVIQSNNRGCKRETVHSSTTSKSCKKKILYQLLMIRYDVMHYTKGEGIYSESLGKPNKQNTARYQEKLVKEESVKNIDSKCLGISTISGKQNTVRRYRIK